MGDAAEPTPWELMRGIERLENAINLLGGKVVSTEVYLADKRGADERIARAEARLRALELALQEAEKLKRSQRFTIAMAVASPIITIVVTFAAAGGLVAR